jgi:DNA (cytosine-5)-methyltransferase 1
MKHVDLFTGIGGFALATRWMGWDTIAFCENDKFCQKVLRKHWPNIPIVEDIRDVKKIKEIVTNTKKLDGTRNPEKCGESQVIKPRGIGIPRAGRSSTAYLQQESPAILVTAGFPCQPFSVAGKRGSTADDRYLWPETLAVIEAVKPQWVLLENVAGIIPLALDTVLSDLEGAGYSTETLIVPACAVNAPHRRDRVWIIAYSERARTWQDNGGIRQRFGGIDRGQEPVVADTRLLRQAKRELQTTGITQCDWWAAEPRLGRVAHGIPNRVDRLKSLGNAIVPQVAYEIFKAIEVADAT